MSISSEYTDEDHRAYLENREHAWELYKRKFGDANGDIDESVPEHLLRSRFRSLGYDNMP